MKTKYLITILSLIAIIVLGLVILNDKQSVTEPVVDNNVATTTVSSVPSLLTLASLQALPDWNPTMEVEGMKRVEDNNPELEVKNLPIHIEENSGFVLKHLEQTVTEEACTKHHLSNTEGYRCYEASPELFNELIVLSKDTGEVLHKYKLNKGYSLINNKYAIEGGGVFIEEIGSEEYTIIGIYIFKWDDFSTPTSGGNNGQTEYYFNLETGEITRE